MDICLYFVVPCYNDEETLPKTVPVLVDKLHALIAAESINQNSRLLLVNDGSSDSTWETILELKESCADIIAVNLAENAGEQNALLAGMSVAMKEADCAITLDSDLQDDIRCVDEMLEKYTQGCEIVYAVRKNRENDSISERTFSSLFYLIMRLARTGLIPQHSNYRLMSNKAIAELLQISTPYFLPCAASCLELNSAIVYHERLARAAGSSGYNFCKKLRLALFALCCHFKAPYAALLSIAACFGGLSLASLLLSLLPQFFSPGARQLFWTMFFVFLAVFLLLLAAFCLCKAIKKKCTEPLRKPRFQIKEILK